MPVKPASISLKHHLEEIFVRCLLCSEFIMKYTELFKKSVCDFDGGNLICQITLPEAAAEIYMII